MVRMKARTVIREGKKSKYFFGSCLLMLGTKTQTMKVKSIKIEGVQHCLIANFEITQTFIHTEKTPKEAKYVFPNDLKICIYDTTFVIGEEIIKPELKMKEEASDTYEEAIKSGRAAIYGSNAGYSLTEFKLGNLPPKTEIKVILKVAFACQITNEKSFFIKFPLDVYTPSGSSHCLYSQTSDFTFIIQGERDKIKTISSNFQNEEFDEGTKNFSLHISDDIKVKNDSILITFETINPIQSSALISTSLKYDCCALTLAPDIPATNDTNCEFIFVVDCSGSMGGKPIERASECLEFFIKSLPPESYFNIIRFGSSFVKLFKESEEYTEEKAEEAIELARNLSSDLGGTNIYGPLNSIYKEQCKHGQRQIFIITDGEVYNVEETFDLVTKNSNNNRCFTIGLGRFCDAGLVEGIANLSGGQSDFVDENDSISEKVIPQLQASFNPSLTNIEIHITNNESFEISPFPIKPIHYQGSELVFVRAEKKEKNSFDEGIMIEGKLCETSLEYSIENESIEKVEDIEEDKFGCSGGRNIGKAILPLFSYNLLRYYEMKDVISDEEKQKAIELSISSGVLCKYTAFVGMSYYVYKQHEDGTARRSTGGRVVQAARKCTGGKTVRKSLGKSENDDDDDESQDLVYSLLNLTRYQKIAGFWDDLDVVNKMLGLNVKQIDGIDVDDKKVRENCIATILSVAAMRVKSLNEKKSWILIEQKAINWLKKKLPGVNIDQIISNAEKLVH